MKYSFLLFGFLTFLSFTDQAQSTVTDIDGNVYNTITIGSTVWMKENLRVTRYNNGDVIGTTTPVDLDITLEAAPSYQWAYDGNQAYVENHGRLYTYFAVRDERKLCPEGWILPDSEFVDLINYLIDNGYGYEGSGWDIGKSLAVTWGWALMSIPGMVGTNPETNNTSGFSFAPTGVRLPDGTFTAIDWDGFLWENIDPWGDHAKNYVLGTNSTYMELNNNADIRGGLAVRCVKDPNAGVKVDHTSISIDVYPNPAVDRVYIKCSEIKNANMKVYNMVGVCVHENKLDTGLNELDVKMLEPGVYVMTIVGNDLTVQKKFTKR